MRFGPGTGEVGMLFVRFQAAAPNRHGRYPGVFALVNGLARSGRLTANQERFRRRENAWYEEDLVDPGRLDPSPYDRARHPGAEAWFKSSAARVLAHVDGYLAILDAHGIEWSRLSSTAPGRIIYNDSDQVIVEPFRPATG
ncbi:hypothetical protein [Nocardia beijingensis]|uniref:hypothetical protein n=1 Tax=Nocardia beijingensis TaxID=95162 RepID=UPI001E5A370C|nr:hypothetical protein [Nocardia beijingensis]